MPTDVQLALTRIWISNVAQKSAPELMDYRDMLIQSAAHAPVEQASTIIDRAMCANAIGAVLYGAQIGRAHV